MVRLSKEVGADKLAIIGFPCNQFMFQEPQGAAKIKASAVGKGFTPPGMFLMEKTCVNGPKTHPVYQYLKHCTQPDHSIAWNFGTYFLVDPEGHVRLHAGVSPNDLADGLKEVAVDGKLVRMGSLRISQEPLADHLPTPTVDDQDGAQAPDASDAKARS